MARKPPPGPSLFGDAVMAPVEKAKVEAPPPPPPAPGPMTRGLVSAVAPAPCLEPEKMNGFADQWGGEDLPHAPAIRAVGHDPDLDERPKLRVVPPPASIPEEDVVVEPLGEGRYLVAIHRHYGTTAASVVYTRKQLEMLIRRAPAALEVG